jgi:nitroreductase/NAD-dependent dihydropyrimidine dehydrogenase PreA subunit
MIEFRIDEEKCIRCGECAADCPYGVIVQEPGELPRVNPEREGMCIRCKHCVAVCKPGALSVLGVEPEGLRPLAGNLPSGEQVETLVMGRRSVRRYKDRPVPDETMDHLLRVASNAPTGVNNRQVTFTMIRDAESMDAMREEVYVALREVVRREALPESMKFYANISRAWEDRRLDVLFRDAPHLLVVSTPAGGPTPKADGYIALSYFELLAQSLGLGTLWNGLANWMFTLLAPNLADKLNLPEGDEIVYSMVFGYPAVRYHRVVDHRDARISVVQWPTDA